MRSVIPLTGFLVLLTVALGLQTAFISEQIFLMPFALALAFTLVVSLMVGPLYRAPEGKAGIVYHNGFFRRVVLPGQIVWLMPLLESVEMEIDLQRRSVEIVLRDIYTADRYPVDAYMQVFYQVDAEALKALDRSLWPQIRQRGEALWDGMVRIMSKRLLAESVHAFRFEELGPDMWGRIDEQVREKLQAFVGPWAIRVRGVSLQDLRPGRKLEPVLQAEKSAQAEAAAISIRLGALTTATNGGRPMTASDLLLAMLAQRAAQPDAGLPPLVLPAPSGDGNDCDNMRRLVTLLLMLLRSTNGKGAGGDGTLQWRKKAS